MTTNLIAELIRVGVPKNDVARKVAAIIGTTEKTARNKINGKTDWTLPEAIAINNTCFAGRQNLAYLFEQR